MVDIIQSEEHTEKRFGIKNKKQANKKTLAACLMDLIPLAKNCWKIGATSNVSERIRLWRSRRPKRPESLEFKEVAQTVSVSPTGVCNMPGNVLEVSPALSPLSSAEHHEDCHITQYNIMEHNLIQSPEIKQ